jgi:hypothetical protein
MISHFKRKIFMDIPNGKFNRNGIAENSKVLEEWGDRKSFYCIYAVSFNAKILTGHDYRCSRDEWEGGGSLPRINNGEIFNSIEEAISYHKNKAIKLFMNKPEDLLVLQASMEDKKQLLLFN